MTKKGTIHSAASESANSTRATERAAHTPGPWRWHWRDGDEQAPASVFAEPSHGHAYAVAVCPRYQTREQWEADASLIAAAPDLLSELKKARHYVAAICARSSDTRIKYDLVVIDATIARATGGQS